MSEIRVNSIKNEAGSGAVELTHGATIPSGASLSGAGGLNVTGVVTATSFSGPLTGNVTGNADTADTLNDGANITTGTISDDRLPDLFLQIFTSFLEFLRLLQQKQTRFKVL